MFSQPVAKKLMVAGGSLYAICLLLGLIVNWSVYGKAGHCSADCSISWELSLGKISAVMGYAGLYIFLAGLLVLATTAAIHRKDK